MESPQGPLTVFTTQATIEETTDAYFKLEGIPAKFHSSPCIFHPGDQVYVIVCDPTVANALLLHNIQGPSSGTGNESGG